MNLKRQLLLVSLLTLVLPWAGCEFIRETESALRQSQQQMLSGTASAVAESLERYPEEFPARPGGNDTPADQLYGHRLDTEPATSTTGPSHRARCGRSGVPTVRSASLLACTAATSISMRR